MTDPVRLSKRLIELTGCTRREAELYIEGGWVTVDGVVVELPQHPVLDEQVVLNPKADLTSAGPVTLLVHRPAQMALEQLLPSLDGSSRWPEDRSGLPMLKRHLRHLQESLPLEAEASGLCVLTQNRYLARAWQEQLSTLEQEYTVDFEGELGEQNLARLNQVLEYRGKRLPPAKVSLQKETRLRVALKNPQPGQIAHLCQSVGLGVLTINRLRIGAVALRKMPVGQWRYLSQRERF